MGLVVWRLFARVVGFRLRCFPSLPLCFSTSLSRCAFFAHVLRLPPQSNVFRANGRACCNRNHDRHDETGDPKEACTGRGGTGVGACRTEEYSQLVCAYFNIQSSRNGAVGLLNRRHLRRCLLLCICRYTYCLCRGVGRGEDSGVFPEGRERRRARRERRGAVLHVAGGRQGEAQRPQERRGNEGEGQGRFRFNW